ncbi:MAG TPA: polyphosphate kinase 2 family protein [Phycisphaerae bacterium]|nr:polyphosphate kinase 2 family protein [Phycisphaerae bacterium]
MNFSERFMVKPGGDVNLNEWEPDDTAGFDRKKQAKPVMKENLKRLSELQYLLYAENKRSVLIVLQAMDAAGKDGTIRHVMGPLNPQSCRVVSFKAPSEEELAHDFLWRIHRATPRKGQIGIFNRSHYEDVLIVRVRKLVDESLWSRRYEQINDFEKMLASHGVHILKFYLHISKDEQLTRFRARLEDPTKHWKVNPQDFKERRHWKDYMRAYQDVLRQCSTAHAPWFAIPSNRKWFRNLAVSQILVEVMEEWGMEFPEAMCDVSKIKLE